MADSTAGSFNMYFPAEVAICYYPQEICTFNILYFPVVNLVEKLWVPEKAGYFFTD
jgi:hypothetical protein